MSSFFNYRQLIGIYRLSREEKLLLQASALQGRVALEAWQEWKESVDIEILDSASNAMLCQLYHNLSANQVEDWHMARLKGIYKRTWYNNQLLIRKLQTVLKAFKQANIETIVNGDAAILSGYCDDSGQFSINDFNLLVHPTDGKKAITILNQLGWNQVEDSSSVFNEQDLSLKLEDKSKTILNLQGRIFWIIPQEYTDKQLWENALICSIGDNKSLILGSIDLFLHLCVRTFYRGKSSHINLLLNAMILQKSALKNQNSWNWIELVTQAQKYQVILPLRNMLILLRELLELSFPDWVLPALDQMPVASKEYLDYQVLFGEKRAILKSVLFNSLNTAKSLLRTIK